MGTHLIWTGGRFLIVLFFLARTGDGTTVTLVPTRSFNISCENTIQDLQLASPAVNDYCISSFHAWKLPCIGRLSCLMTNTCNETLDIKYVCKDASIPYDVLITDPDLRGKKYTCRCQCSQEGQNTINDRILSNMSCSCVCEDRQVPFLHVNSPELEERLLELKENMTISKHKTTRYQRTKNSIPDRRKSSTTIGVFGIIILSVVVGCIIIIDIPRIHGTMLSILHSSRFGIRR